MLKYKKGFHRHHIIPKHAGGTDDDENITYLTREEHIQAHLDLYCQYGKDEDRRAALILEYGYSKGCEILHSENCKRGALAAHKVKLENGFYDRLGAANRERLKGVSNPDHSIRLKEKFQTHKMFWWNNGIQQMRSPECPGEGWIRGRIDTGNMASALKERYTGNPNLWWNNGIKNTRSPECPGPEWHRGKLTARKFKNE